MKRAIFLPAFLFAVVSVLSTVGYCGEDVYYARCNLKVLKDNSITWINWQSAPTSIPVGTKLMVTPSGNRASVVNPATNVAYALDIGADSDAFLDKFVTKKRVDISSFPSNVQANIRNAVAKVGMTKEQVYIAMGPPT